MSDLQTTVTNDVSASAVRLGSLSAPVKVALALCGLCLSAQVKIPVPGTVVPLTLQSLAVLLAGFLLTPKQAITATLLYLLAGLAGLPVFAYAAGLFGVTGGYLFGFVAAAWLISMTTRRRPVSTHRLLLAGTLGTGVIFACGLTWQAMGAALLWDGFSAGWGLALQTGFWPFAAKSFVQLLFAVALVTCLQNGQRFRRDV